MRDPTRNQSVEFFDSQFRRQIRDHNYVLNPFETLALDHLMGTVLNLGSGLGNLSLEAARRGHRVVAVVPAPEGTRKEFSTVVARKPTQMP